MTIAQRLVVDASTECRTAYRYLAVRGEPGRNRCHINIRQVNADLNPILRGWGTTCAPATPPPSPTLKRLFDQAVQQ
ncbi:MAG: hypothetical protein ACRDYX_19905 [Egibacteraceae bacterium]